jgi:hypothetical protein
MRCREPGSISLRQHQGPRDTKAPGMSEKREDSERPDEATSRRALMAAGPENPLSRPGGGAAERMVGGGYRSWLWPVWVGLSCLAEFG